MIVHIQEKLPEGSFSEIRVLVDYQATKQDAPALDPTFKTNGRDLPPIVLATSIVAVT